MSKYYVLELLENDTKAMSLVLNNKKIYFKNALNHYKSDLLI